MCVPLLTLEICSDYLPTLVMRSHRLTLCVSTLTHNFLSPLKVIILFLLLLLLSRDSRAHNDIDTSIRFLFAAMTQTMPNRHHRKKMTTRTNLNQSCTISAFPQWAATQRRSLCHCRSPYYSTTWSWSYGPCTGSRRKSKSVNSRRLFSSAHRICIICQKTRARRTQMNCSTI